MGASPPKPPAAPAPVEPPTAWTLTAFDESRRVWAQPELVVSLLIQCEPLQNLSRALSLIIADYTQQRRVLLPEIKEPILHYKISPSTYDYSSKQTTSFFLVLILRCAVRVIVCGQSNVGKSPLCHRFVHGNDEKKVIRSPAENVGLWHTTLSIGDTRIRAQVIHVFMFFFVWFAFDDSVVRYFVCCL